MNVLAAPVQTGVIIAGIAFGVLVLLAIYVAIKCFHKVSQGETLIRNGMGGSKVTFSGMVVWPVIHRAEYMDISVKRISIMRRGDTGLVCHDNIRADIEVSFFVRVNNTSEDVMSVAQALGCKRASDENSLHDLFDSKFSEALKTVGKRFEFIELYTGRDKFKEEILQVIGRDLNGYVLEDAAIDYLEQTDKKLLNPDNILDAEGIKKITVITAKEFEFANAREREKDKTITQQNVEAQEAILELNKQLAEAEAKQKREIATIQARETAETKSVEAQESERQEKARIAAEEQIQVADENKQRQIIVAARAKERTDKVETERVEKDRELEHVERTRVVSLADLDKDKAVEGQKRELQSVIRDRVEAEKAVVAEEENIKNTREFATADRSKRVKITKAEEEAEQALVKDIKEAEAAKRAAEQYAEKKLIDADAEQKAADKNAAAIKTMAEAHVKERAVDGVAEAQVMEAKASATRKQGEAEADVMKLKYTAEAEGITEKADAMKKFHEAGQSHEEFKLALDKDLQVEMAEIEARKKIAAEQAGLVREGLKQSKIDIIGGENRFFERLVNSVTLGKQFDRVLDHSDTLSELRDAFIGGNGQQAAQKLKDYIAKFDLSSEDVKNLTISTLMIKLIGMSDGREKNTLQKLFGTVRDMGMGNRPVSELGLE
ncbi:MAG: flotillin family protein [Phycisphaerae bacterium]